MIQTETKLCQKAVAEKAALEALDALDTVYWGDSYNSEMLLQALVAVIETVTRFARPLSEPCPNSECLEEVHDVR